MLGHNDGVNLSGVPSIPSPVKPPWLCLPIHDAAYDLTIDNADVVISGDWIVRPRASPAVSALVFGHGEQREYSLDNS